MSIGNGTKPAPDFIPFRGNSPVSDEPHHQMRRRYNGTLLRPSEKWRPEYATTIERMAANGFDAKEIATALDIRWSVFEYWVRTRYAVQSALAKGQVVADNNVTSSLYARACGYSHPEEKIFCSDGQIIRAETTKQYPPDTAAAKLWLTNRRPAQWRDRVEAKVGLDESLESLISQVLERRQLVPTVDAPQTIDQDGNDVG